MPPYKMLGFFYDVAYKMRGFDTRACSWIFSATCEECSRLLVSVFGLTLWAERFRVLKVLARTSARRVASVSSQVTANLIHVKAFGGLGFLIRGSRFWLGKLETNLG